MWRDRRALACLGLVVLVLGGGLCLVLARTAERRTGSDGVRVGGEYTAFEVPPGVAACQGGELLPARTAAVEIPVIRSAGAATVSVWRDGRLLDRSSVHVDPRASMLHAPIPHPPARDVAGVRVCVTFRSGGVLPQGGTVPDVESIRVGDAQAETSMAIAYVQPGRRSWFAAAATVAARIALGRGDWGGRWIVYLLAALVAASLALTAWVVLRTVVADRRTPGLVWTILAIAVFNAAAWSIITPPFQAPDEVGYIAYVQSIGETGRPPSAPRRSLVSPELTAAMAGTRYGGLRATTFHTSVWSSVQQRRLDADLHAPLSRSATAFLGPAEPEPPLYFALEAIAYRIGQRATLLDRIALMRLGSALLAGITAALAFLFLREALPGRRWAWMVGGLGVAFTPKLGSIGGSVTPDALLFAIAAAVFLCLAQAWRRGVTTRRGLVLGVLLAAGVLTKVNFYALVPGALLGFALAARRSEGAWDRHVAGRVGMAAGVAGVLFAAGTAFQVLVWGRPFMVGRPAAPESHVALLSHLSYIWQIYLPRLPFQARAFPDYRPYDEMLKTFVAGYGRLAVWFPNWVYRIGAGLLGASVLLALRALAAEPRELRWRLNELAGYATMALGVLATIAVSADLRRTIMPIIQGRYLMPLLPLLGALFAMGARGAGERWGRAVGVTTIAASVAWTVYSELVTIAFFYS